MFRPDPNGEHSTEEIVAKLSDALTDVPLDSPRAFLFKIDDVGEG